MNIKYTFIIAAIILINTSCSSRLNEMVIDKNQYRDQLEGFWLGQCIANWTGLITEGDKIGIPVDGKGGGFYTRENWGGIDHPNIWGSNNYSETIDFIYAAKDSIWGADDDTDIEYMYQELLIENNTLFLDGEQIRAGWLNHIYKNEENYLWVSNQRAFDLMQEGIVPPDTSDPKNNPFYEMIDAQLTTEIFGLYAPGNPETALSMSYLPIRTSARENAAWIAEFYVIMHSLATYPSEYNSIKEKTQWMASRGREHLPNSSYAAKMYDFVLEHYHKNTQWEKTRDLLHEKYQINQDDNYFWSTKDESCNGCFAAGINFGASIISLLYGEGDIKETIKIAVLSGWDSDNPAATWGGLLGFMIGKKGITDAFGKEFSDQFNIHRTRKGFKNEGIDTFKNMADKGLLIIDKVVTSELNGLVDNKNKQWKIPVNK